MKKKIIIPVGIVALVVIIIVILSIPPQPEPEITVNPKNTQIYAILANAEIEDAVVDITQERALIRYNTPANLSEEAMQVMRYYMMEATATVAPDSSKIVIQAYKNFKPLEEVTVATKDVLAFMNGSITFDEFKERIIVKSLK